MIKCNIFTKITVQLGRVNIDYVRVGSGGSKALLLLTGSLGTAESDFRPQLEAFPTLLKDYTIIACNPASMINFHSKSNFNDAKMAQNLMRQLHFESYSILGWCYGGATAMIMSAMYPEEVEKLVIWGSKSFVTEGETKLFESMRAIATWSEQMRQPKVKEFGEETFTKIWSSRVDAILETYREGGNICKEYLDKIKCPTFILHGAKDPVIDPVHVPHLRRNIRHASYYEFPNGKHNVNLRYPEEFNNLVVNFLLK